MSKGTISLEEMSTTSDNILLDSSIILGTYSCLSSCNRKKIDCAQESIEYFIKKLETIDNLFLTEKMYSELSKFSFLPNYPESEKRAEIEFQRSKQEFLDKITLKGKIIQLSNKESKKYNELFLKYQRKKERYDLSNTDYDLAVFGLVYAKWEKRTSIISNDNGIKKIIRDFLNLEYLRENLSFFNHVSLGNFRRIGQNGRYKI